MTTNLASIAEELSTSDPLRFGTSLIAPAPLRGRLWTLYAMHHELSRIPFSVSEPALAEIRLAWWQGQLEALGEGRPATGHPTLEAVAAEWGADAGTLAPLIDGHLRWCQPKPFHDHDDVLAMIDATSGRLMQKAAGILAPDLDTIAALQGRGSGIIAFFRGWPALHDDHWLPKTPELAPFLIETALTAFREAALMRKKVPSTAAPALYAGPAPIKLLKAALRDPHNLPQVSEFKSRLGLARLAMGGKWWV